MKEPARPGLVEQPSIVVVEHSLIVQVFQAVRTCHDGSASEPATSACHADPQAFRAGSGDDIVWASLTKHPTDGGKGSDRPECLTHVRVVWQRPEVVAQKQVARVSEPPQLTL